ncbi:MAG: hypothetical protein E6H95_09670 [Chloroflexi bacterium]|nr:MAG: hypothetical protein E6H95_09670 [Chloroflexota bacterium]
MLKTIFASVTAVAATVLLSIGASGATVQHFNLNGPQQCYAKGDYLVCVIASGEENAVQAPSGNFNAEINGTSYVIHEHVLYTSDFTVLKEGGIHETSTVTSGGATCIFAMDVHATGLNLYTGTGRFQYTNVSFTCV